MLLFKTRVRVPEKWTRPTSLLIIRFRLAILLGVGCESHDAVMRSISADSLRHGHAPSLLILFLRYLENQSNQQLILPCKFLMIN